MKKYRVNVVGTKYITTDTEDKAIEHTQDMLDHIHKSLNMQVFSIAEVREEKQWKLLKLCFMMIGIWFTKLYAHIVINV